MGLVRKFTIDDLIELPRRSPAVVNATGTYLLYTVTEYHQKEKERTGSLHLLDVHGAKDKILLESKDAQDPVFVSDTRFLYLSTSNGKTTLKLYDIDNVSDATVHEFDGSIANLQYDDSTATITFSAFVGPDGKMMTAAEAKNDEEMDALVYDKLFVRHWDAWKTTKRNAIFTSKLTRSKDGKVMAASIINAIHDPSLESPSPVFGSTADFSIFGDQLAFMSKDPRVNPAYNTASQIWLQSIGSSQPARRINDTTGASSCPSFSKDGKKMAYLQMNVAGYEAARNCVMIYDIAAHESIEVATDWDRSPSSITWGADSETLFLVADDEGYKHLFELKLDTKHAKPTLVEAAKLSVAEVNVLADGRIILSSSSIARAMVYSVIDRAAGSIAREIYSGKIHGLSDASTSTFWFDSGDRRVQALMVKPHDFDEDKKYPMLFLIHGGPQGAWTDSWSTRWNPSVMANYGEGYIVIAVNPTGSTGYGQAFTDAIKGEWGSKPYDDLYNGFKFALKTFNFIDPERCAAAGGSYGGYMVNWIQGHEFGRKLKALVCHDGVFNTYNVFYTTEELYFPEHDFLGVPWDPVAKECYEKFNPANHVEAWATPQLIIHGSRDYRLTEGEALAAFNVLQRRGIESRLLIFKSENHFVLSHANSKIWNETVMQWVEKYTAI